jgi:hypothetical protein
MSPPDVPVFFRPPPGRTCHLSLRGQRKVAQREAAPRTRPSSVHGLRVRSRPPGFAEGTSLCLRRTGPHPAGHPSDLSGARSPCSRGPDWHGRLTASPRFARRAAGGGPDLIRGRSNRQSWRLGLPASGEAERHIGTCSERGHGWPVSKRQPAPLAVPQPRGRSREQGAHVRAQGCASSRRRAIGERQGQSRHQDGVEITATGALVFGCFLPKQKVARSPLGRANPNRSVFRLRSEWNLFREARGKRHGRRTAKTLDSGIRRNGGNKECRMNG